MIPAIGVSLGPAEVSSWIGAQSAPPRASQHHVGEPLQSRDLRQTMEGVPGLCDWIVVLFHDD